MQPTSSIAKVLGPDSVWTIRNAFSMYLGNTILALATPLFLAIVPFLLIPTWLLPALAGVGIITTLYAFIIYQKAKAGTPQNVAKHCYILAILGFALALTPAIIFAGLLYAAGGYQLASTGYWLRQTKQEQLPPCPRDGGELVILDGRQLACRKRSHVIKIGIDIPAPWRKLGLAGLVLGIILRILQPFTPSTVLTLVTYVTAILLTNGLVFVLGRLLQSTMFAGHVRIAQPTSTVSES